MSLSQGDVFLSCPGSLDLGVLLPHLAGVIVETVTAAAGLLLSAAIPSLHGQAHDYFVIASTRSVLDAVLGLFIGSGIGPFVTGVLYQKTGGFLVPLMMASVGVLLSAGAYWFGVKNEVEA